jgi:hypothetical protein
MGFPGLTLEKMDGVWYLLGDDGVTNQFAERCLHCVSLKQIDADTLRWKVDELTKPPLPPVKWTHNVRAQHRSEQWAFEGEMETRATEHFDGSKTYYAQHGKYGCGKNYPSRHEAIRGMLSDHGCYNIEISEV